MTTQNPSLPSGAAKSDAANRERIRQLIQILGMLPILLLICIGFELATGKFMATRNIAIVMQQASINMVLAAGMTFVILTGGIDLAVGSILALCAVVAVSVSLTPFADLAIPAAMLAGIAVGLVNGALVAFVRLPPFIVTLGAFTAARGIARLLGHDTTVFNPNLPFAIIGQGDFYGVPWLVVIGLATIAVCWFVLRRTVFGMRIYAVGGNQDAARLSGIKVWFMLLMTYAISGMMCGLGGVMAAARTISANGAQLGTGYELDAIAAVVLGGTSLNGGVGSIIGTLVGALIIAVLSNGLVLMGVPEAWQFIIKGAVIIGAVTLDRYRNRANART
jgi:ribose transport system permease protein